MKPKIPILEIDWHAYEKAVVQKQYLGKKSPNGKGGCLGFILLLIGVLTFIL
jgi:hypothetical protein